MRHNSELYSLKRSICFSSIITVHLLKTSWKSWSNTKITTCKPPGNQELYKELGFPYPASENWKCKSEITAEIKKKNSGKKISHVLRRWLVWHSLLKTKYWTCCYSSQSTRAGQDKSNTIWNVIETLLFHQIMTHQMQDSENLFAISKRLYIKILLSQKGLPDEQPHFSLPSSS